MESQSPMLAFTGPWKSRLGGGCSLYPLQEFIDQFLWAVGYSVSDSFFAGNFDNYVHELSNEESALYQFNPEVVFIIPAQDRCRYDGPVTDDRPLHEISPRQIVDHLLHLAGTVPRKPVRPIATTRC